MMTRLLAVLLALLAVWAGPGSARADQPDYQLVGQVRNGTPGGVVPAGLEIRLSVFQNDQVVDTLTTKADAGGNFAFGGLKADPGYSYVPWVWYQGASYFGRQVSFVNVDPVQRADVTIYEATDSAEKVATQVLSIAVADVNPDENQLVIFSLVTFSNRGDRTYVSRPMGMDVGFLPLPIPAEARNIVFHSGPQPEDLLRTPQGYGVAMSVPPGDLDLAFAYILPFSGGRLPVTVTPAFPVERLLVLVPKATLGAEGAGLTPHGQVEIQKQTFDLYVATGLAAGQPVEFSFTGLPEPSLLARLTSSRTLPFLVVGGVGVVLVGAGVVWARRSRAAAKGAGPGIVAEDLAGRRVRLVAAIADLDERYERGEVAPAEYAERRAALKAELLAVTRQLTAGEGRG